MRALVLALALAACGGRAFAVEAPGVDAAVAEAAAVFDLPEPWIRHVMTRESGGDARAVSRAGALGLMQLMPRTWDELRARLGLGADPFDVRDNVMAGAAYLRQMLDQFGPSGFLAAYNAGPGRYADALAGRAPLPRETRAYVAALAPQIGGSAAAPAPAVGASLAPRSAGLFPSLARDPP